MLIARRLLGQGVEEGGVDVIADAEGEDARVGRVLLGDVLEDLLGIGFADGRLAIGEEDDGEGPGFVVGAHGQGGGQGVVDGGAAGGFERIDPLAGRLRCFRLVAGSRPSVYLLTRGGEVHQAEAIFGIEVFQAILESVAGLGRCVCRACCRRCRARRPCRGKSSAIFDSSARGETSSMK